MGRHLVGDLSRVTMFRFSKKKLIKIDPNWEEIFTSFGDGLVILDRERRLIGINPAAEQLMGYSAESSLGYTLEEAFPENKTVLETLQPSFEPGWAGVTTLRQMPWKSRYREPATVDLSLTPTLNEEGVLTGWLLVFRDVTPLQKLEEEVRKSDRLAMMGTLAAGLAHEIKNPLGGIRGAAQLLLREKKEPSSKECLNIIVKEVDRVDRLVEELLSFSRPRSRSLAPVNLNKLLDSLLMIQSETLQQKNIRLVCEFDPSLPLVLGDAEQLLQVFLNVFKNAIEAIPEAGGEIRIKSRIMTNYKIKEAGEKASRMVMAEIQDSGMGIAPDVLKNIFTPFFTTKEKGHGLGLAISQRVIHEHGGVMHIESKKGKGTVLQVLLRSVS